MRAAHKTRVIKAVGRGVERHRAGRIIVDPDTIVENGYIDCENGAIKGVFKGKPRSPFVDHGPGILMPPLVNAHLHLELSALKDRLPFDLGFQNWVQALLKTRTELGEKRLAVSAGEAARTLARTGTLFVGDISTLGITGPAIRAAGLSGVLFHEFLGSDIPHMPLDRSEPLSVSVAGHAPHTTSPGLLNALKRQSKDSGLPFSIHVAESDAESEFISDQKGSWADFLSLRGIDWPSWKITGKTPVRHLSDIGLLDSLTLLVHVLNADAGDLTLIAESGAKVCICPKSNLNLHRKLPDIEKMIQKGIQPALGTDSLASSDSLDIFDEMAFVRTHYPDLDARDIFKMATINGASALGLDWLTGSLSKGKKAEFVYRQSEHRPKTDIFQELLLDAA